MDNGNSCLSLPRRPCHRYIPQWLYPYSSPWVEGRLWRVAPCCGCSLRNRSRAWRWWNFALIQKKKGSLPGVKLPNKINVDVVVIEGNPKLLVINKQRDEAPSSLVFRRLPQASTVQTVQTSNKQHQSFGATSHQKFSEINPGAITPCFTQPRWFVPALHRLGIYCAEPILRPPVVLPVTLRSVLSEGPTTVQLFHY